METQPSTHPTDQALRDYGLGKLDDAMARTIDDHLRDCEECHARVARVAPDSFLDRLCGAQAPAVPDAETLPAGLADHPDYRVKHELGRGGMGVVYLAHNTMMGRDEVLKVIGRNIVENPAILRRFQDEIRAVAKLRHPNIVAAYTAFRLEGGLAFAMEYVEGLDLAKLVRTKGPLAVAHAAYFIHQAALGLQHAHERGMVHRDIKPHNLMLTHDGKARVVKVLDFGLAKVTREQKVDGGLTVEGQALGTPDYIAPEQILNAASVDIRADIYSLGGTLYYLLTGRPPFQANSLYDIYQAHISRDADPLNLVRPEVPAELAALVAKMMAKEPDRRFQTPAEVAKALTPFFKPSAGIAAEVSRARSETAEPVARPAPTLPAPPTSASAPAQARPSARLPETVADPARGASDPAPTAPAPPDRPRRAWPLAVAAASLAGVVLLGIWIKVRTRDGVILLEDVPEGAAIRVDGRTVVFTRSPDGKPVEIRAVPGEHKVEVEAGGARTFGETVTVKAGGTAEMTVRLGRRADAKANGGMMGRPRRDADPSPGFVPLFNGRNTAGWKESALGQGGTIAVEAGSLVVRGGTKEGAAFVTDRDYGNAHIRAEIWNHAPRKGVLGFRSAEPHARNADVVSFGDPQNALPIGSFAGKRMPGGQPNWQKASMIRVGRREWFALDIVDERSKVTISINGQEALVVNAPRRLRPPGPIVLGCGPGQEIYIRKLEIKELDGDGGMGAPARPADAAP
ncbi:protein kinase domain-containing protein [Tundrisphaera sp. TA3]|uniref:protein kinase domain-containing protein n=1 Tax=Tundrisphaera sp. TA3 TaxID=3435775 RepID=UPI003EB8DA65